MENSGEDERAIALRQALMTVVPKEVLAEYAVMDTTYDPFQFVLGASLDHEVDALDRNQLLCTAVQSSGIGVGWVPGASREGDKLCVFAGAPFTFVVRPLGNGHYKLLGDAYLAKTTLTEAIGGSCEHGLLQYDCDSCDSESSNDWNHKSREMRRLIRGLDLITLE